MKKLIPVLIAATLIASALVTVIAMIVFPIDENYPGDEARKPLDSDFIAYKQ
jgi:hypothetical protein